MKPLIVLLIVFIASIAVNKLIKKQFDFFLSGRIAMATMLLFTAIGHFKFTEGMAMMMPDFIPMKSAMVYITGVIEIVAAIGLLMPKLYKLTAWLLIIFFIAILPANIHAAIHHIDFQNATYDGHGLNYLWFRVPLQIFFIVWVWFFGIRQPNNLIT
jgi:uncharacterized membrane protein